MEKLKVLIVDNSIFYKKILSQAIESTGLGHVEHTASNGALALERLQQRPTDVVLLDLFAPKMNGTEILETIRKEHPGVFVILFNPGGSNDPAAMRALEMSVLDVIQKPPVMDAEKSTENIKHQLQGLFAQIMTRKYTSLSPNVSHFSGPTKPVSHSPSVPARQTKKKKTLSGVDLVVIASSTGGPSALETVCKSLPMDFNKPILVIQHMPVELTKKLAQSLEKKCSLPVFEAKEGDLVKPGQVMIAPGGFHMTVQPATTSDNVIKLDSTSPVNGVRPAADVLFRSVANAYRGQRILAIILTGMGSDGMLGVEEIKKTCDCYCLAQSEKTCTVYGMPKSVVDAGLSDEVIDLNAVPNRIVQIASGRSL